VNDKLHTLSALPPEKNPSTHRTGGWDSPKADLGVFERIKTSVLCRYSNPGPSIPFCSYYIDCVIPGFIIEVYSINLLFGLHGCRDLLRLFVRNIVRVRRGIIRVRTVSLFWVVTLFHWISSYRRFENRGAFIFRDKLSKKRHSNSLSHKRHFLLT
jgi:hypothetical protein